MTQDDSIDWLWLDAYFAGTLHADEQIAFEQWVQANPCRPEMLHRLRPVWERRGAHTVGEEAERRGKQQILAAIHESSQKEYVDRKAVSRCTSIWWRVGLPVALAAICLVAVRFVLPDHIIGGSEQSYVTAPGERLTVTLADSTRITLAPQSRMTVSAGFGARHRNVMLEGRAYFRVMQQETIPFVVHTGAVQTQVLGTAFDVSRYVDDTATQVVVMSGKVALGIASRPGATLAAGMQGIALDSVVQVTQVVNPVQQAAWVDGGLYFRDTRVSDMLRTLSRWYSVRFDVADSVLLREQVTTYLQYDNTADLIMALEKLLNVTISQVATPTGEILAVRLRRSASKPAPAKRERVDHLSPILEVGR